MLKTIFHVINNLLNQSLNESFCLKICVLQGVVKSWARFFSIQLGTKRMKVWLTLPNWMLSDWHLPMRVYMHLPMRVYLLKQDKINM